MLEGDVSTLLLQSNITRFGTVLFLIFVLSVLVSLYRYILRLAAFYDSRGHALILTLSLAGRDVERFEKLVGSMMAETIDFKQPAISIQQIADLKRALEK